MTRYSGNTVLLATDRQRSMLASLDGLAPILTAYAPYGHHPFKNDLLSLVRFNGEQPDPLTGHYHLGNGYRQFNPVLRRFNAPDSWSPFGRGGINAYAYCAADPVNRTDPSGHIWGIGKFLKKIFLKKPKPPHGSTSVPLIATGTGTTIPHYSQGLTAQVPGAVSKSASTNHLESTEFLELRGKGKKVEAPSSPWSFAVSNKQNPVSEVISTPAQMSNGSAQKPLAAKPVSLQTAANSNRDAMLSRLNAERGALINAPGPSYLAGEKHKRIDQIDAEISRISGQIRGTT